MPISLSRRELVVGTATAAALTALSAVAAESAVAATPSFAVSTGKVVITPNATTYKAYPMGGFAPPWNGSQPSPGRTVDGTTPVNEDLHARCTVLWDSGTPRVIVTAEVLGFGASMHQSIRTAVTKPVAQGGAGLSNANFVLTATHTHNGPVLIERPDPVIGYGLSSAQMQQVTSYSAWLVTTVINLVKSTVAATRTPCTLSYSVLDEDFSYNRDGLSYVERNVPTLVATDMSGNPRAILFSYGTHPIAAGSQSQWDPDFPGVAIDYIENYYLNNGAPNIFAQYLTGPAGDQNPTALIDDSHGKGFQASEYYGTDLGETVVNAIDAQTGWSAITGGIATSYQFVSLPLDVTLTQSNMNAVRADYVSRANSGTAVLTYEVNHANAMATYIQNTSLGNLETSVSLPIQAWLLPTASDAVNVVFSGGEVVSGYAVYFRAVYSGGNSDSLWFNAYSNEVPAYIPSNELLNRVPGVGVDTYEAGRDSDFPGIAAQSMAFYKHLGHFKSDPNGTTAANGTGVEATFINAVTAQINAL